MGRLTTSKGYDKSFSLAIAAIGIFGGFVMYEDSGRNAGLVGGILLAVGYAFGTLCMVPCSSDPRRNASRLAFGHFWNCTCSGLLGSMYTLQMFAFGGEPVLCIVMMTMAGFSFMFHLLRFLNAGDGYARVEDD